MGKIPSKKCFIHIPFTCKIVNFTLLCHKLDENHFLMWKCNKYWETKVWNVERALKTFRPGQKCCGRFDESWMFAGNVWETPHLESRNMPTPRYGHSAVLFGVSQSNQRQYYLTPQLVKDIYLFLLILFWWSFYVLRLEDLLCPAFSSWWVSVLQPYMFQEVQDLEGY